MGEGEEEEMTTAYKLTSRIRDLINAPRKQESLLKDRSRWLQLCSSLDVIGDTELALESYAAHTFPKDKGAAYLIAYGALQALYLQQDGIRHLAEALDLINILGMNEKPPKYPRLKDIREIRNASTGHPTKKGSREKLSFHFISRFTLTKEGFQLLSNLPDGTMKFDLISIPKLVKDQINDALPILTNIVSALETEEEMHRTKFRDKKLEACLPQRGAYDFQKILEATLRASPELAGIGKGSLSIVRGQLDSFLAALAERGLDASHIKESIAEIAYPLSRVAQYFDDLLLGGDLSLQPRDAHIYASFAEERIGHLRATAREIDEEYASPVREDRARLQPRPQRIRIVLERASRRTKRKS
jgi:hypothetical protein